MEETVWKIGVSFAVVGLIIRVFYLEDQIAKLNHKD